MTGFDTQSVKAKRSSDAKLRAPSIPRGKTKAPEKDLKEQLEDLLQSAKDTFVKASDAWSKQRRLALDDIDFFRGNQWSDHLRAAARTKNEPTITVNRLPQFCAQVENELRRQQISINVYATDEQGSEETADVFAGIIRAIERDSYAPSQYIHAAGIPGAMVVGFGFLKLDVQYAERGGFNQEIRISSPDDPFKVIPDPNALAPDSSDAQFWFEFEDYAEDDYRRLFPGSEMTTLDLQSPGSGMSMWTGPNGVRVCRYWYREELEAIEYLLEDGTTVNNLGWHDPTDDLDEQDDERLPFPTKDGASDPNEKKAVLRTRTIVDRKVKWCVFNGVEILDHGTWATSEFPFVSIYGPSLIVDGERDIHGMIRYAKDSQRIANYLASSAIRRIGSANKSPWIVDAKSVKGYESFWKTANTENWSMLPYNSTDPDNPAKQLAPPQRADTMGQITDLLAALESFENSLKATLGVYDAGVGATEAEQSGIAIKTLAQQGQNGNYHFSDSLSRGIQRLGVLLIDLIPKVYDTPRAIRIIGADTSEKLVKINQIFVQNGESKQFDLSSGTYGVAVSAGPAYATRKQQAVDSIVKLCGADPGLLPIVQDILLGEMDFDGAPVIQERLKKLLAMTHPNLIEDDTGSTKLPPQAQAALAQQNQAIQGLTLQLQQAMAVNQQLQSEKATGEIKFQHDLALVQANMKADLALEAARMDRTNEATLQAAQLDAIKSNAELEGRHHKAFLDHQLDTTKMVLDHHAKTTKDKGTSE